MKNRTYRYMEKEAQYPFGYGLNYGEIEITGASLSLNGGECCVVADAACSGKRDTEEVLQVYIRHENSPYALPNPTLCAFLRIRMKAGEKSQFRIPLPEKAFSVVDDEGNRLIPGGNYNIYVGFGQPDKKTEELTGKKSIKLLYTK